jgi:hypothetical protein
VWTVGWNRRVEHILAAVCGSGQAVTLWHLKENKPILTFADTKNKHRFRALAWHPLEVCSRPRSRAQL